MLHTQHLLCQKTRPNLGQMNSSESIFHKEWMVALALVECAPLGRNRTQRREVDPSFFDDNKQVMLESFWGVCREMGMQKRRNLKCQQEDNARSTAHGRVTALTPRCGCTVYVLLWIRGIIAAIGINDKSIQSTTLRFTTHF